MKSCALVLAVLVMSCADPIELGSRPVPIVNGELDTGDPATVFLWLGGGSCSGTLISPRVVLTARHCLEGVSLGSLEVFFGSDADGAGTWIGAVDYDYHGSGDIGILTMESPGPATPIPAAWQDLSAHAGEPVRIVGFGVTSENGGGSGTKRQGMTALHHVDGDIMYTGYDLAGSWTCYGDSGGPNFMMLDGVEHVAGVTSFGTTVCGQPADGAVRTDTYYDWIMAYVNANDPADCGADTRCAAGCGAPDPDCPCAADGFCTAACADVAGDVDCDGCGAGDGCREDCPAPDADCEPDAAPNDEPPDAGHGADPGEDDDPGAPGLVGGCSMSERAFGATSERAFGAMSERAFGATGATRPVGAAGWLFLAVALLALRRRRR